MMTIIAWIVSIHLEQKKLKSFESMCKNHNYCHSKTLEEFNRILKCNQGQKSMRIPFTTYADTKSLLEEIKMCESNPENH